MGSFKIALYLMDTHPGAPMKRLILLALVSLSLSLTTPAQAARTSSISTVGVASFDSIFEEAREIDDAIISGQRERRKARVSVNTAMGMDKDTPFADSLKELRSRAPSGLSIKTSDGLPKLTAQSGFSGDVNEAVDAVNSAVARYSALVQGLVTIPQSCQQLVGSLKQFSVDRLRNELSISSPEDAVAHLVLLSTYQTNIQTIGELPQKVKRLVQNLQSDIQSVRSAFSRN
ncbi:MAG: hypothetical protein ACI8RZ_001661 [Myxococcota bacterium]|jgi:hypothetical protein